tara:strand:- start:450 stop:689 length:240 start_codon:yes stop_codon:yes gene_type:complete
MEIAIIIGIVTIIWIWIVFQLYYAPEYDENEMPIVNPKRGMIKHRFHIDIKEDDINQDLGYKNSIHAVSRKRDDKEDVK